MVHRQTVSADRLNLAAAFVGESPPAMASQILRPSSGCTWSACEALRYILGHDGVWKTTADDIAQYYIANYYDEVLAWIAERKTRA